MNRYQKKPITVEAVQFNQTNKDQVYRWATSIQNNIQPSWDDKGSPILLIPTLEGEMVCAIGDYLIREPFPTDWRKIYQCKESIFNQTYEEIQP